MKITAVYRIALIGLLVVAAPVGLNAQVEVRVSTEKVSIGGVAYYIHIVKRGETLYSIAKAYRVSTEVLMKENRSAVYGLSEGDPLKIPVSETMPVQEAAPKDTERYIYHKLQEGETIFSLSRRYNIPEDEIIESNPGVNVYDLPVGAEIAVPRRKFMEQPEFFNTAQEGVLLHRVERGETLADIAARYDVTLRELRSANRRVVFPREGDYVRIPGRQPSIEIAGTELSDPVDTTLLVDENITRLFDGTRIEFTRVEKLSGTIELAVMLPLYLEENSQRTYIDSSEFNQQGRRIYKTIKRADDWIYPRSRNFVEYYEGVLLAVDNLRSRGLNVNLSVFDTRADSLRVSSIIESGRLRDADIIIGPVYTYNVQQVADYARRYRIPVVSPLATRNSEVLRGNPYLFKVQPSLEVVEEAMARIISEYSDYNLIFVHSDTAWSANLSSSFKNNIYRKLRYMVPFEDVSFREVFFTSRSAYSDTINIIDHALSKTKPNLVIIASEDEAVMSEVIVNVHTLLRNYKIEIIGYPGMRWLNNLDPLYFHNLNAMMLTPAWVDYSQEDVKDFIRAYRAKFNMEPPVRSYAWQSYDITYYFLSGIALYGSQFKYQPGKHHPDLLQTDYRFSRTGLTNGYENERLFVIRYTPGLSVEFPKFESYSSRE